MFKYYTKFIDFLPLVSSAISNIQIKESKQSEEIETKTKERKKENRDEVMRVK